MLVYKYRGGSFSRDLEALKEDFFWAPTREHLNDPCEGLCSKTLLDQQLDLIHSLFKPKQRTNNDRVFQNVKSALQEFLGFTDKAGIYSLSKSPYEELLWAHYACSHTGFCIEYDLEKLLEFEAQNYNKIDVLYKKAPPKLSLADLNASEGPSAIQKLLGTKPESWSYEQEIRVITPAIGRHNYDFRAVKTIFFGLRMPEEEKNEVMHQLRGRNICYKQISLIDGTYKLGASSIKDPYQDSEKYKYAIAPIQAHAIYEEDTNDHFKKYMEYLYKAAEVVRREPYCNIVELVNFSAEKGSPAKPVVFVQYKRKEHRWVNRYLTLPEIDKLYSQIDDMATNEPEAPA